MRIGNGKQLFRRITPASSRKLFTARGVDFLTILLSKIPQRGSMMWLVMKSSISMVIAEKEDLYEVVNDNVNKKVG